jgi:hypothetical protein
MGLGLLLRWPEAMLSSLLYSDDQVQSEDAVSLITQSWVSYKLLDTDVVGRTRGCEGVYHAVTIKVIGMCTEGISCHVV